MCKWRLANTGLAQHPELAALYEATLDRLEALYQAESNPMESS
jgi:hypothetical protein